MGLIVGIDASRNRSGGARAHLVGILDSLDPSEHGIDEVHLWSFHELLQAVGEHPWLVKHNPPALEESLSRQILWQGRGLAREATSVRCDVLFATDASTVCHFKPMVVLSQDMLSYEPGVMKYFGWSRARARLLAILYLQNWAFRRAQGVIFLTHYAARVIQQVCGDLQHVCHIPHGVGAEFQTVVLQNTWPEKDGTPIRILYVSNTAFYKHQWNVVEAVAQLRDQGYSVQLELVGGGEGEAQDRLEKQIAVSDPNGAFVSVSRFVPHSDLLSVLSRAHVFVFASGCENMPVTLVEAMAAGLPIACSNRGPMPEVLQDGGVYFDPHNPTAIATAIMQLITEPEMRTRFATRAKELSRQYSWARCARETFAFIEEIARPKQGISKK